MGGLLPKFCLAPMVRRSLSPPPSRSMPSGLRVTRIDRAPAAGSLPLCVNGMPIGGLTDRTMLELTVSPGDVLVEVSGLRGRAFSQVVQVAPGCTARVQIGRRRNLGIAEASHYLQVDPSLAGLPDRSLYPLNLAAHSAAEWLRQKRALGEQLSYPQLTYLQSQRMPASAPSMSPSGGVPSLVELGAFAALGLESDAEEADVREAFRLLVSIHAPESGQSSETLQRLQEAYRIAMNAVATRLRPGVSKVGR